MAESNMTKRALAAAMKQLMSHRPFAKINVGDICELCSMNRKSFYYHFRDKYDLVNWIFQNEFLTLMQTVQTVDYWELVDLLCTYFYENRAFYNNALSVQGQNSFSEYFQECITPVIRATLDQTMEASDTDAAFVAEFFADAFTVSIMRWLSDRHCMDPHEFTRLLRLCLGGLKK